MFFDDEEVNDGSEGARSPSSGTSSVCDVPLPPLPPPLPPSSIYGMATEEIYSIIKELRRQIDDPATHQDIKAMLKKEPSVLLAVVRVLHESALLRRTVVNVDGRVEEQLVPLPEAPTPPLPSGWSSWA
ncbi:hypothetical protein BCY84_15031 [Trypanosoma cruzi cruzi]|uniref:Uncharacterized protein n=1 Tax=Trypanosoma cruzi TaxID=5693 RepID=A0A2V2VXC6_TRYCR|nr:putative Cleavage stimulating factor 64 [Trypanosoma cruzi]PBJ72939.1 hypothetical protein BCY84_15031 [Trypanosoma cruzi cruzi]PWU99023.1 hypothetical protein C4B63_10g1699c [Trypanosoma cruzi]